VSAATSHRTDEMLISVREARLTLDRIFLAAGVPDGIIPSVREHALISAALGLGGWTMVRDQHREIGDSARRHISLVAASQAATAGNASAATIDGGGQHAWIAGATILDLAIDAAQSSGDATVAAHNVLCVDELAVLAALGSRHGVVATATALAHEPGAATVAVSLARVSRASHERDPVLHAALHRGLPVGAALWWELHHLSNRALSPDTVESRRHAGPIIVTADGRVIGRPVDDETDVSLLRQAAH